MNFESAKCRKGLNLLMIPVFDDAASWDDLPDDVSLLLRDSVDRNNFNPRLGRMIEFFDVCDVKRLVFVGMGKVRKMSGDDLRLLGVKMVKKAKRFSLKDVGIHLSGSLCFDRNFGKVVEGVVMGNCIEVYKNAEQMVKLRSRLIDSVYVFGKDSFDSCVNAHMIIAGNVMKARALVQADSSVVDVKRMEEEAFAMTKISGDVSVTSFSNSDLKDMGAGLILGVNKGSVDEARLVEIDYTPEGCENDAPVVLIGKGVVFDTGGNDLKSAEGMVDMNCDMAGSAVVLCAARALAELGVKKRIVTLLGLTDNVISATAYRPSDVLTSMSGKTVEVLNTDAEGRLVLADAITFACKKNPALIIDCATLTGAVCSALGLTMAGLFTNSSEVADKFVAASATSDDALWRLPISNEHRESMKSKVADIANIGDSKYGGAGKGAAFLEFFLEKGVKWAHIDLAGPTKIKPNDLTSPNGYTGYGVRLLVDYLR